MPLLPDTDGTIELYQGRDCTFTVRVLDEATGQPQVVSGYELQMQIRATVDAADFLIDCALYATSSESALTSDVVIPGGISAALDFSEEVDWIADAKFVKTISAPVSAVHAGRFTVAFVPQVTR